MLGLSILQGGCATLASNLTSLDLQKHHEHRQRRAGVVVWTIITGGHEKTIKEPEKGCSGANWLYYSDRAINRRNNSCWESRSMTQHLEYLGDPRTRNTRYALHANLTVPTLVWYKLHAYMLDDLLPYRWCVWVDGTVVLRMPIASPIFQNVIQNTSMITAFEHCAVNPPSRWERCRHGKLETELHQTVASIKAYAPKYYGRTKEEAVSILEAQRQWYFNESGFKEHWFLSHTDFEKHATSNRKEYGVFWVGLMVFNLANPETEQFLDTWFYETMNTSLQCQVTFSYAAWKTGLLPHSLPAHGVTGNWFRSSLHKKGPHGK
jgi:hypothetical protein